MAPKSKTLNDSAPEFVPNQRMVPGSRFTGAPSSVVVNINNQPANLDCPEEQPLYEKMISFLRYSPIFMALTEDPEVLYFEYLQEFWFTVNHEKEGNKLVFTLKKGSRRLEFDMETFRRAIKLDYLENSLDYEDIRADDDPKRFLRKVRYQFDAVTTSNKNIVQKRYLSATWRMLSSQVIQCLFGASGGHDQLNTLQIKAIYALKS